MVTDIEFFSREQIENVATCLKCNVDKVVYVGYEKVMTAAKKRALYWALKEKAAVSQVEYVEVLENDLRDIIIKMDEVIKRELEMGNECFMDLTGGENLVLVAAGILADRYKFMMRRMDIKEDKMYHFAPKGFEIEKIQHKDVKLDIAEFIKLNGAGVNDHQQKSYKDDMDNPEFVRDIKAMWKLCRKNRTKWNDLCRVLSGCIKFSAGLDVVVYGKNFSAILNGKKRVGTIENFVKFLEMLRDAGLVTRVDFSKNELAFSYKNEKIMDCLCDPGCALELYSYVMAAESGQFDDVRVGVHLDWDGVTRGGDVDVRNEIDVVLIRDNVPTFISCKNGRVDSNNVLYELDTVAEGVGGRYTRKILIATQYICNAFKNRAKEMGIKIIGKEIYDWEESQFVNELMRW